MYADKAPRLSFGARLAVGVGFFGFGALGLVGSVQELRGALHETQAAATAERAGNVAAEADHTARHSREAWTALGELVAAGAAVGAGAYNWRGAYNHFMHIPGSWAWEENTAATTTVMPVAAPSSPEQLAA